MSDLLKPYEISLRWGDGEYPFALRIGEIRRLEEKAQVGIGAIYGRLAGGVYHANDIFETILQGLIGGGMVPAEASKLVEAYGWERPLHESVLTAQAILMVRLFGNAPEKQTAAATAEGATAESTSA